MNLLGLLQEEVGKDAFDMGRIKVIFRVLKIAKPTEAINYLATNFAELVVFAMEMTLLMQVIEAENPGCFDNLSDTGSATRISSERIRRPSTNSRRSNSLASCGARAACRRMSTR